MIVSPQNKKGDELMQRILQWVVEVMKFIETVPRTVVGISTTKQLADSVGSTGANFVEARAARTHREFISSIGISEKECKESLFWLIVLREMRLGNATVLETLLKEGNEIASILTSIGRNAKLNQQ